MRIDVNHYLACKQLVEDYAADYILGLRGAEHHVCVFPNGERELVTFQAVGQA